MDVGLLTALATVVVLALWFIPGVFGTLSWFASGESGCLLTRGLRSSGSRLRRTIELGTVVSRLALITRLNLPLNLALQAAASGETPRVAGILRRMANLIAGGNPVSVALKTALPECPKQLIAALSRGEDCGQFQAVLDDEDRAISAVISAHLRSPAHARHAAVYASVMVLVVAGIIAGISIVLMPKIREIFLDFNTPLPTVTLWFLDCAAWLSSSGLWLLGLSLLLILVTIAASALVLAGSMANAGFAARTVAVARWAMPVSRSLDRGFGLAKAIRAMRHSMRGGAPAEFVATLPTMVSPANYLRFRLMHFAQAVADGTAPHEAARAARLGDVLVSALAMVERGEDPERVLGFAADYYEAIAYRWWHALAALSVPTATLAIASVVAFAALALFMPLVALINAVSESI